MSSPSSIKMRKLTCDSCGATLDVAPGSMVAECPYCGTRQILEEDKDITIERIRSEERRAASRERKNEQKRKEEAERNLSESKSYKKRVTSFFTIILIFLCAFAAFYEFDTGNQIKGLIALLQVGLLVVSWFMGTRYIKTKNFGTYRIPKVIALLLIFAIMSDIGEGSRYSFASPAAEEVIWSDLAMGEMIPEPDDLTSAVISSNSDSRLRLEYSGVQTTQYNAYVKKCKEAGYTIDISGYENHYVAYNESGYKLDIYLFTSNKEMEISLDAPIQMYNLSWPNTSFVSLLPEPESHYGSIVSSSEDYFNVYIGETTREAFMNYTNACINAGFNVEYSQGDDYFSGKNADGYKVYVSYEGFNTMKITLYSND